MQQSSERGAGFVRDKLIGLGENSIRKNYYPELQKRIGELETFRNLLDKVIDGILMIRDSKSPALVREMLLAYLPEKHRHEEGEPVPA